MSSRLKISNVAEAENGITRIHVRGYKSIYDRLSLDLNRLTVLAGTNSSGKSSVVQPLLLLKQTLEAPYDPGPLLLNGPNVKFNSARELLSRIPGKPVSDEFEIGLENIKQVGAWINYRLESGKGFEIESITFNGPHGSGVVRETSNAEGIVAAMFGEEYVKDITTHSQGKSWSIERDRCFLTARIGPVGFDITSDIILKHHLRELIHLPGLRGNPERSYPVAAVGSWFPGTFKTYVASIIVDLQQNNPDVLQAICQDLQKLNLTSQVAANRVNDTQVELQVGRLPQSKKTDDLVNVADVGLGVSQTLPVVVALRIAKPGQLVFIEQPEIHLHPQAQVQLAGLFADAANRGVRVILETHSSILLLGLQTLVAEGKLPPDYVKLHWFSRGRDGATRVQSAEIDRSGAFGDWPEDFDDVTMRAQSRYMDAAESVLRAA